MTTNNEKLQQLFAAALKASPDEIKTPTRAFPTASAMPVPAVEPAAAVFQAVFEAPATVEESAPVAEAPEVKPGFVKPMENAGLDEAESKELGILLDAQIKRKAKKRRREALITLAVFLGLTGGSFGWFVQSPQRVTAFKEAIHDIRSVGDIAGMVAKYKKSLDKIAARSQQIDDATASMGMSTSLEGEKDANMDAEMRQLMGSEGKTVGERNKLLGEKLGKFAKAATKKTGAPEPEQPVAATASTDQPVQ